MPVNQLRLTPMQRIISMRFRNGSSAHNVWAHKDLEGQYHYSIRKHSYDPFNGNGANGLEVERGVLPYNDLMARIYNLIAMECVNGS